LIKKSKNDIYNLSEKSDVSIAVAFLIPHYPKNENPDWKSFNEQVLDIKSYKGDFAAIHFSDEQIWKKVKDKKTFYPGIAIVGKYV